MVEPSAFCQSVFAQQMAETIVAQAEGGCRILLTVARLLQGAAQNTAFEAGCLIVEGALGGASRSPADTRTADLRWQLFDADLVAPCNAECALHGELELSNIAGPAVRLQQRQRLFTELQGPHRGDLPHQLKCEKLHEGPDILAPLTQRRQLDFRELQAIVEISAEPSVGDRHFQVGIGRCHNAHIHLDRRAAADALEFLILDDAQQILLKLQGRVADFVEKERAAVSRFKATAPQIAGSGEGSLLVAEELRLQQRFGQLGKRVVVAAAAEAAEEGEKGAGEKVEETATL